jgi:uncharacterized membrane protein YhhN
MTDVALLAIACLVAASVLVWAERRDRRAAGAVAKILASTAFVLVAWRLGATASGYGRLVLAALALSWAGDALLLSRQRRFFLAGIGAFLLAHVAFAAAFAQLPVSATGLVAGAVAMAGVGVVVLR